MYGPGNGHLQSGAGRSDPAQALELLDRPQPVRGRELADDPVTRSLVVCGRAMEARCGPRLDPFQTAVEAEVEVKARLLSVRDHVEPGSDLVVNRDDDRVLLQLGDIVRAELVQSSRGVLEPTREGVAPDHRRAQRRHCRILAL